MKTIVTFTDVLALAAATATAAVLASALALTIATANAATPTAPPVFTTPLNITNPYQPFQVGAVKVFTGTDHAEKTAAVDIYLAETRSFMLDGNTVECRILRELNFTRGALVEITDNYFAQAADGTVYYFGEVVNNYEDGVIIDHHGSWLVGGPSPTDPPETATALVPAVFMPGTPELGDIFKPEDLFPLVDESDEIIGVDKTLKVPAGRYQDVILIRETTQLSASTERKWYAPRVGVVKARSKGELLQLTSSTLRPAN